MNQYEKYLESQRATAKILQKWSESLHSYETREFFEKLFACTNPMRECRREIEARLTAAMSRIEAMREEEAHKEQKVKEMSAVGRAFYKARYKKKDPETIESLKFAYDNLKLEVRDAEKQYNNSVEATIQSCCEKIFEAWTISTDISHDCSINASKLFESFQLARQETLAGIDSSSNDSSDSLSEYVPLRSDQRAILEDIDINVCSYAQESIPSYDYYRCSGMSRERLASSPLNCSPLHEEERNSFDKTNNGKISNDRISNDVESPACSLF